MSRRNWIMVGLLAAVQTGAQAGGGGGVLDPLALLRQDSRMTQVEALMTHATVQRWRVRWGEPATLLDLLFSNEAVTAAQAQTVRQITAALQVPGDRALTLSQVRALDQVIHMLAADCLSQAVPVLTDLLRGRLDRPLPAPGTVVHLTDGLSIDVVPGEAGGRCLQVTVRLGGPPPRCQMPVDQH